MKFTIGDKVILKHTGEEGVVIAYLSEEMLEVEVNGTKFPVFSDEIDHPYLKWFTEKTKEKKKAPPTEQIPVEKIKLRAPRLAKGVYLSFLPLYKSGEAEDIVEQLKVYLLNELPVDVFFNYNVKVKEGTVFSHEGRLPAFNHIYLHHIPYDDMNDQPRFHWRLEDASGKNLESAEGIIRIKPSKLFEQIHQLMQRNEPSFSYLLTDDFVPRQKPTQVEPQKKQTTVPVAPKHKPVSRSLADLPKYEVDLHIEQLVESRRGMSNADILQLQIATLNRYLHLAILHRQERMIVIHGMGTGALREAVHQILRLTPEVAHFANEWIGQYGFGATEVHFQY